MEWTSTRIIQRNLHQDTVNFWKLKTKNLKTHREKWHLTFEGKQFEGQQFFIRNHVHQKEVANSFEVLKEKTYQSRILYPVKIVFQDWMGNKHVLQWSTTKGICCQQIYPKRMAKKFSKQKGNNKWMNLITSGRKAMVSKNMVKYSRLYFSWVF